jgi:tetratricopeptide (TPR) repeat protein
LNPYDSTAEMRLAESELKDGHADAAVAAWKRAIAARPFDPAPRNALLQYLTDAQQYQQAYDVAKIAVGKTPRDSDLLINFGILASKVGRPDEALDSWHRALRLDPHQGRARLYIAQTLDREGKYDAAIPEYAMFLDQVAHSGIEKRPPAKEIVAVVLQLADCQAHANRSADALRSFELAGKIASQSADKRLQSVAAVHEAEYDIAQGEMKPAMQLYQQALRLDSQVNDSHSAAVDWYNYGLLLRRAGYSDRFVYACLWKANSLLQSSPAAPEAKLVAAEFQRMHGAQGARPAFVNTSLHDPDGLLKAALTLK